MRFWSFRSPLRVLKLEILVLFFTIGLAGLSISSCRDDAPPELPPEEIVNRSAEVMKAMESFHFIIERTGSPAFLDPDETISFRRAEGYYLAPDRAQATVRVIAPGFVTDVSVISIGTTQWETNLLTNEWHELPPNWGFNPAVLFDPEIGIQSILTADLKNVSLVGTERIEDGPDETLYLLEAELAGDRINEMSYGLIGPESLAAKMWVAPESFELIRAQLVDPNTGEASEETVWQVDFGDFGIDIQIKPPDLESS